MGKIYIIGGGPSLKNCDMSIFNGVESIAVNESIHYVKSELFITIDYTFLRKTNRKAFRRHSASKFFVANYHAGLMDNHGAIECPKVGKYDLKDFDVIIKSRKPDGLSRYWKDFRNGMCSGYCAMQLAVILGYDEIHLCGIDMTIDNGKSHFHNSYGTKIAKLNDYFNHFVDGIELAKSYNINVVSRSSISRLNRHIDYIPLQEGL